MTAKEKVEIAVRALDSKRAEKICALHVEELTVVSEYFVIANGTSSTHVRTLADEVDYRLSNAGVEPEHREGRGNGSNWIAIDYGDVIVHIFDREAREFYQLERLWADAENVDIAAWIKSESEATTS